MQTFLKVSERHLSLDFSVSQIACSCTCIDNRYHLDCGMTRPAPVFAYKLSVIVQPHYLWLERLDCAETEDDLTYILTFAYKDCIRPCNTWLVIHTHIHLWQDLIYPYIYLQILLL